MGYSQWKTGRADNGSGGQQIKYGDEFVSLHPTGGLGDSDLQYLALQYAKAIDEEAAYSSISMGLCQLMGFNYETAGFSSVEEMYDRMSDSYEIQIEAMIKHIKNTGLDQGTVREFFEGYNTKKNADNYVNRYDKEVW